LAANERESTASGYIKATNTEAKRERAIAAVDDSAFMLTVPGDTAEAVRQWNIVFNGNFPSS